MVQIQIYLFNLQSYRFCLFANQVGESGGRISATEHSSSNQLELNIYTTDDSASQPVRSKLINGAPLCWSPHLFHYSLSTFRSGKTLSLAWYLPGFLL